MSLMSESALTGRDQTVHVRYLADYENLISMTECHLGRSKPLLTLWRLRRG
jgi:hypothetical protein